MQLDSSTSGSTYTTMKLRVPVESPGQATQEVSPRSTARYEGRWGRRWRRRSPLPSTPTSCRDVCSVEVRAPDPQFESQPLCQELVCHKKNFTSQNYFPTSFQDIIVICDLEHQHSQRVDLHDGRSPGGEQREWASQESILERSF